MICSHPRSTCHYAARRGLFRSRPPVFRSTAVPRDWDVADIATLSSKRDSRPKQTHHDTIHIRREPDTYQFLCGNRCASEPGVCVRSTALTWRRYSPCETRIGLDLSCTPRMQSRRSVALRLRVLTLVLVAPFYIYSANAANISAPGLHAKAVKVNDKVSAYWPTDPVKCDLVVDGRNC